MNTTKDLGVEGKTLGEMLHHRAESTPNAVAYRSKRNGSWTNTTWKQAYEQAQHIAYGLLAQGLQVGDRVALLCSTRAEWSLCDFAVLLAGGVTVPLYPSNPSDICLHILKDSGASWLFVEDGKQWEKILPLQSQAPALKTIVLIEPIPSLNTISLTQVMEQGKSHQEASPSLLEKRLQQLQANSLASITYTSGTTGTPKGVMLTHEAFMVGTRYALGATPALSTDVHLMFLPMAHIFGHMLSVYMVRVGFTTAFAEGLDKLGENIAEVRPTCLVAVPRVFEKVYNGFLHKAESGSRLQRTLIQWALKVGKQISQRQQKKQPLGSWLRCKHWIADRLVFRKIRQRLGGRIRWFISGSAPLSYDIIEFFHMCGMMILEGYGLTETTAVTTVNRMDHFKFGTVGMVHHPSIQLKIAPDGEILTRGPSNFIGYYNLPEATKEAIDEEGWFHTGDIGTVDEEGFLSITDRKKDMIKTSGGKWVAPQVIEGKLKLHALINQVVVIGDKHQYITALFTVNKDAARQILSSESLPSEELARHAVIQKHIADHIEQVNRTLGSWEQIKYFRILPNELTEAAGEVTPSLKIKRKVVLERYKSIIEEMYGEHAPHPEHIVI